MRNHPESYQPDEPAFLLALAGCSKPKDDAPQEVPAVTEGQDLASASISFDGDEALEAFERGGFASLAEKLAAFSSGLNPENRDRFNSVLALMETNFEGVVLKRSTFEGNPKHRASISIPRAFQDTNPPTLTLNEAWSPSNGIDIVLAMHEALHLADFFDSKQNMDEATWIKIYGAPGTGTEIRTELRAWELQLTLLNSLSDGALEDFVMEIDSSAFDANSADQILEKYVQSISLLLNANEDQKGLLKRFLQLYYTYKVSEKKGFDSPWSYSFVTQIASEYESSGIEVYELNLNPEDEGINPNQCLYPIPKGPYDYHSFRPYEPMSNGIIGPGNSIEFR